MSCLIADCKTVSKVAAFIADLLNLGFNGFGFCANQDMFTAFSDCKTRGYYSDELIYDALFKLNLRAYSGRNKKEVSDDDIPKNPGVKFYDIIDRVITDDGRCNELCQEWHYEALCAVNFILYQLIEDATDKDEKTLALGKFASTLAMFIATHTPEYHRCNWG